MVEIDRWFIKNNLIYSIYWIAEIYLLTIKVAKNCQIKEFF